MEQSNPIQQESTAAGATDARRSTSLHLLCKGRFQKKIQLRFWKHSHAPHHILPQGPVKPAVILRNNFGLLIAELPAAQRRPSPDQRRTSDHDVVGGRGSWIYPSATGPRTCGSIQKNPSFG